MAVARRRVIPQWLWTLGESGTWLDFTPDHTFTDTAGTTPAGAGDFIANAGDRSPNGADAVQGTSPARARLSARYNRLQRTESLSTWNKTAAGAGLTPVVTDNYGISPDGSTTAARVQLDITGGATSGDFAGINITPNYPAAGEDYTGPIWIKSTDGSPQNLLVGDFNGSAAAQVTAGGEWQKVTVGINNLDTVARPFYAVRIRAVVNGGFCDETADVLVWHPDLRLTRDTDKPAYQRVGDLTADPGDYDTEDFPYYADLDKTDDIFPVALSAISSGQIALMGRNGYYIKALSFAGGTFEIGPTTYTGGSAGVIDLLGGLLAVAIVDRAFTAGELAALKQWAVQRGAQNEDLNP